jgi:hypothetical protein
LPHRDAGLADVEQAEPSDLLTFAGMQVTGTRLAVGTAAAISVAVWCLPSRDHAVSGSVRHGNSRMLVLTCTTNPKPRSAGSHDLGMNNRQSTGIAPALPHAATVTAA